MGATGGPTVTSGLRKDPLPPRIGLTLTKLKTELRTEPTKTAETLEYEGKRGKNC